MQRGNQEQRDLPDEAYIANAVDILLAKIGVAMTGPLNMSGNLVRGSSTAYPPVYRGDEADPGNNHWYNDQCSEHHCKARQQPGYD